jgi:hypothetical protein
MQDDIRTLEQLNIRLSPSGCHMATAQAVITVVGHFSPCGAKNVLQKPPYIPRLTRNRREALVHRLYILNVER